MNASGPTTLTLPNCTKSSDCRLMTFCNQKELYLRSSVSIAIAMSHVVLIPLCLFGNGLVVLVFCINRRQRTSTNVFVVGLAVSDLLVGMFAVPFWMYVSSYDSVKNGLCLEPWYSIYVGFDIFSGCASILQLTAISLERYLCIASPMKHRKLRRYVYYIMVVFAWSYAIIMAGLSPIHKRTPKIYTLLLFITCFACPLIIITTAYAYVFKVGHNQAKERKSSSKSIGFVGGSIKEVNLALTVVVLTGLFVISWFPFFMVNLIANFCVKCLPSKPWQIGILIRFVKWMQYANCCINPYVYAYRHVEMKKAFIKISVWCFGRKPAFFKTNSIFSVKLKDDSIKEKQKENSLNPERVLYEGTNSFCRSPSVRRQFPHKQERNIKANETPCATTKGSSQNCQCQDNLSENRIGNRNKRAYFLRHYVIVSRLTNVRKRDAVKNDCSMPSKIRLNFTNQRTILKKPKTDKKAKVIYL